MRAMVKSLAHGAAANGVNIVARNCREGNVWEIMFRAVKGTEVDVRSKEVRVGKGRLLVRSVMGLKQSIRVSSFWSGIRLWRSLIAVILLLERSSSCSRRVGSGPGRVLRLLRGRLSEVRPGNGGKMWIICDNDV